MAPKSIWIKIIADNADKPVTTSVKKQKQIVGSKKDTTNDEIETAALTRINNGVAEQYQSSRILRTNRGMEDSNSFDDGGVGWINPKNIMGYRANGTGMFGGRTNGDELLNNNTKESDLKEKVGCLTNDFSMQNTLIQMNLKVISLDGMIVRRVKQWVLRCNACYTISYDLSKIFCPKCGVNHLSRVAASIDSKNGKLRLHLRKDYKFDLAGTKFSLPAPGRQGRHDGEILLREDQLLGGAWKQKAIKMNKNVRNAFGDDLGADLGLHLNKGQTIRPGLGVRNPNSTKGRERRGKKKKK